jgi:hypothetical protein
VAISENHPRFRLNKGKDSWKMSNPSIYGFLASRCLGSSLSVCIRNAARKHNASRFMAELLLFPAGN